MTAEHRKTFARIIAFGFVLACRCAGPMNAGSETTGGVEIAVEGTTIRGTTTAGAVVMIFDAQYTAGDAAMLADTVTADGHGKVTFTGLPPGNYTLFVFPGGLSDSGAAVTGIPVETEDDSGFTDTVPFVPLRTIAGAVVKGDGIGPSSLVFIPGSPYRAETDTEGKFSFAAVPEGSYRITVRQLTESDSGDKSFIVDLSSTGSAVVEVTLDLQ